jgi:DNA-binding transcriptional LysR family regulator
MRIWRYIDEVARAGSLRQAADRLHVTPSALQKRIQDVETDLGTLLFERLPKGMRLTAAGEAFIRWIRSQAADLDRVQSQIEDLSGLRRGLVRIACSQSIASSLLPHEVARFTALHPLVQFAIAVEDHTRAIAMLRTYEADLALIFQSSSDPDFQPLATVGQYLVAIMRADHPLLKREVLRLHDCQEFPLALLDRSFVARQIVEESFLKQTERPFVAVEANSLDFLRTYVGQTTAVAISVQVEAANGRDVHRSDLIVRAIGAKDHPRGSLVLGHLKGRHLPVAAAKFAEQLKVRLRDPERNKT